MSTYVLSDLHGCYDKLLNMLQKIEFSTEDKLYIVGDVLDRGPDSLKIIDYIVSQKNIVLLKGNHEVFFEHFVEYFDTRMWFENGGLDTYYQLMERGREYIDALYEYIKKLPFIAIEGKYILAHANVYIPSDIEFDQNDTRKPLTLATGSRVFIFLS